MMITYKTNSLCLWVAIMRKYGITGGNEFVNRWLRHERKKIMKSTGKHWIYFDNGGGKK